MTENRDPVTIEELDIVRAPGFETGGFTVDEFSPGINLVHGPNAAGKSTTAASLMTVLWPTAAEDGEQLVGQVSLNGEQWRVEVLDGSANYQRDGQEASPPNLPSADQRDRYQLSLHDLLQQETRNEDFAERIERESAGGYDLSAAHDELGYTDSPITRRKGVYQDAKDAVSTWREERDAAESLEEERSRLTRLQDELEEARQARKREEALEQAITYREAKSEYEDKQADLDAFPDVLEEVSGDELQRVEELDDKIDDWEGDKASAEEKKQEANETLEDVDLPEGGISDGVIKRLKQQRDDLQEDESRQADIEAELEEAKEKRETARSEIPFDIGQDDLEDLTPASWADVSEFVRLAEEVQAEQQRRETLEEWAGSDTDVDTDPQTLERASTALENWLLAGAETEPDTGSEAAVRIGAIAGATVALAGLVLGALVHPLLFAVVLVGVGLFVYGYRQRSNTDESQNARNQPRKSYEQTGLPSPESWTEDAVRQQLLDVYDELATHKVVDEREQQRDALLAEQDLDDKMAALRSKREELRESVGAAPEFDDIELAVIVQRVLDWQEAHDEVVGLEAELDEVTEQLDKSVEELRRELGNYGYEDIADAADATQHIRDLEERQSDYETASQRRSEAEETIERAEDKLSDLREEQEAIFTNLELNPGERETLESLCEQVDAYEETKSEFEAAEAVVEQEREELEALPAYDPEFKETELSELKEQLHAATETADGFEEIQGRIKEIEAKIREAKFDNAVEEALTAKERALSALEAQRSEDFSGMVGDILVDHVQEETIEANRPAVFQRANDLLALITHGRYELRLVEGEQTFRAFDTAKQKGFALDELSSGTRIQVLLAVRLAFVENREQRAQMPIVLDETLANTDDLRAEVIIESLIELAKDGRQIFYFTAQGDEVAKWQSALEDTGDVEWELIDLASVRGLEDAVQTPDLDSVESLTPDPPDPAEYDHESYGEALDVPQFNPYDGAETAHLWYLIEDLDVLSDCLQMGIKRWGQLQNLLDRGRDDFVPADAETLTEIRQNAAALDAFTQAWQVGRGEPVDRSVLKASGAVSSTFIDRVTEFAAEVGGDAERLVDGLYSGEVDRFRRNKAEDLEEYFRANGHLVARDPLPDEEIRIRMIERLVESGVSRNQAGDRADTVLSRVTGN